MESAKGMAYLYCHNGTDEIVISLYGMLFRRARREKSLFVTHYCVLGEENTLTVVHGTEEPVATSLQETLGGFKFPTERPNNTLACTSLLLILNCCEMTSVVVVLVSDAKIVMNGMESSFVPVITPVCCHECTRFVM